MYQTASAVSYRYFLNFPCAYVMARRYEFDQDKIFKIFFCFVYLVILTYSFHDSSYRYIKRQTLKGGHRVSEFAYS